jgi:hypothetical protein
MLADISLFFLLLCFVASFNIVAKMASKPPCELAPQLTLPIIEFCHPAIPRVPLLCLHGYDNEYTGINFRTALTACGFVACNRTG